MIKINDHYFIAWLVVVKKYEKVIKNKNIYIKMTSQQYTNSLEEYSVTMKPLLKEIRHCVRELNNLTS